MIEFPHGEQTAGDDGFGALLKKIEQERGVPCGSYKDRCLRRRVSVRMRANGVHTFGDYSNLLDTVPTEWERLLAALTINVTRFFRDESMYELLESKVYPELRDTFPGKIRAWSAGCSHGQEALSLAMGLAECAGLERVSVLATDIDDESLFAARECVYNESLITDIPADRRDRWFERVESSTNALTGQVRWQAIKELRTRIVVRRNDLLQESPPATGFHLITCRNVIIYFDRAAQTALFERLYQSLAPGGVLVLGMVETLVGPARELLVPVDTRQRVYQRALV